MAMSETLKRLMQAKGWTESRLAREAGVSQPTINAIVSGKQRSSRAMPQIARALGVPLPEIDPNFANVELQSVAPAFRERDLRVFAAVEGGSGEMIVSSDPIDLVPRPWFLGEVKDGFAVIVVGESMSPAFEHLDMAIVNPRLPMTKGKVHILVREGSDGTQRAMIKRVVRWTDKEWHLEQFNPQDGQERFFSVSRADWPRCLRVVGKYESY